MDRIVRKRVHYRRQSKISSKTSRAMWKGEHRHGRNRRSTRKKEWTFVGKKGTCNSRRKNATQSSQLIWFCMSDSNWVATRSTDLRTRSWARWSRDCPRKIVYIIVRCFLERVMGQIESPSSWKLVKLVLLRITRRGVKEVNQKLQNSSVDVGDVKMVRIMDPPAFGKGNKARKV